VPRTNKPSAKPGKVKGEQRITRSAGKAKGRRLQQWCCERISLLLDLPWGKDEGIASREMGQSGTDVRLVGEAARRFPFSVECKAQESWSIPGWIAQARENQAEGTRWLLVCKRNREEPVVVMDAREFFRMIRPLVKNGRL
jgi:hypothetical protein